MHAHTYACHEMPPSMALQQDSPRETNGSSKSSHFGTEGVVQIPNGKATDEYS